MSEDKAPKVINKSGTLKMTDEVAAKKEVKDIAGKKMDRRNRRDRVKADVAPKEFDEITIAPLLVAAACVSKLSLLWVTTKTKLVSA